MATWWELVIPAGGALIGALSGTWLQARNSLRVLKIQNLESQRAENDKHKHDQAMHLFEDKKAQYADFLAAFKRWERITEDIPERGQRRPDEMEKVGKAEDQLEESYARLFFIASPDVLEVADGIFLDVISDVKVWGGAVNHFIEVARGDLGVGGAVPTGWAVNRNAANSDDDEEE